MERTINRKPFLLLMAAMSSYLSILAQNDTSAAFAAADTSRFSLNRAGGWQLYNSYVASYHNDSAQIELIVQHLNDINWAQEQYLGRIKLASLQPVSGQSLNFFWQAVYYRLRIDKKGKCYLTCLGSLPTVSPMVIPVKVYYKL